MDNSLLLSSVFLTLPRGQSYLEAAVTAGVMSLSKVAIKMHVCCVSGSVCKHKLAERLGKAHGNRVCVPGRAGARLPDVCSVERRPGRAQGESSTAGLGEEAFS